MITTLLGLIAFASAIERYFIPSRHLAGNDPVLDRGRRPVLAPILGRWIGSGRFRHGCGHAETDPTRQLTRWHAFLFRAHLA
jgi:hypothetical protein